MTVIAWFPWALTLPTGARYPPQPEIGGPHITGHGSTKSSKSLSLRKLSAPGSVLRGVR